MNKAVNYFIRYLKKCACLDQELHSNPPEIVRIFMVLISTFACVIVLDVSFRYSSVFKAHQTPDIPSWVAAIILTCNGLESPFGQPFNIIVGTLASSFIGICLAKLWMLNPENEDTLWVCAALSAAITSIMMSAIKSIHPAACSAGLLPIFSPRVRSLGWFYLVIQLVSGIIIILVSMVFGNIYAQYPLYWLLPPKLDDTANTQHILSKAATKTTLSNDGFTSTTSVALVAAQDPNNLSHNDDTEDGDKDHTNDPSPEPYMPASSNQSNSNGIEPIASTSSYQSFLSRAPTQEDDEDAISELASRTRTRVEGLRLRAIDSIRATASYAARGHQYLRPIPTSVQSTARMVERHPGLDLNKTVIITATDYSFPSNVNFSFLDKSLLSNIQKKLLLLDKALQLERLKRIKTFEPNHGNNVNTIKKTKSTL